jgi:parallel beta-helix repeat protein
MKTLDQVRSTGIAINDTNTPGDASWHFIISTPGSYYLTGNLGVTKPSGIHVTVAAVTVDLNGFQISRSTGAGGDGLTIDSTAHRCTIKNGSFSGFGFGINSNSAARGGSVLQISVSGCTNTGISTGAGWEISGCKAHDNTGTGIHAGTGSALTDCTATNNQGTAGILANGGCSLTNCAAYNNTTIYGIYADTGSSLTNCTARSNASASNAISAGIYTGDGCTLTHCTATANTATASATTSAGIYTGLACTITACTAEANTNTFGTPLGSTGAGIIAGTNSKVQNCSAAYNKGDGISVSGASSIIANVCVTNGNGGDGAGVHVTGSDNRIEGNSVTSNHRGIDVDAANNLIIKNSARANIINYDIAAGNIFGAIVDRVIPAGSPTPAPVSGNSAASSVITTDPWANISY